MDYKEVTFDAYEIANKIFDNNSEINKNISFENIDIETFFEMLLIISTEGLKKFFGDSIGKVDVSMLTQNDINKINTYLDKMNIKMIVQVTNNNDTRYKNYIDININSNTQLKELYFVVKREDLQKLFVISFDYV